METERKLRVLGFHGRKGSGKNTAALAFKEDEGVMELAFATHLKKAVMAIYGVSWEQVNDPVLKEIVVEKYGLTPRQMCQQFGTEYGRNKLGKDHWIRRLEDDLANLPPHIHTVIVTDVRFDNESDWIRKKLGGLVIQIIRPSLGENKDPHSSEIPLSEGYIDINIMNEGSIDQLQEYTKLIVEAAFIAE